MRGLEAVLHRQQALGEAFDGELARLGDLFFGAAARVLGIGLGAQVGVGHLGVARLELAEALLRVVPGSLIGHGGGRVVQLGRLGVRISVRHAWRLVRMEGTWGIPLGFKRLLRRAASKRNAVRTGRFQAVAYRSGELDRPHHSAGGRSLVAVDRGAPPIPVGQLAAVALGRPALLDAQCRLDRKAAVGGDLLPQRNALGCFLVQSPGSRRRAADIAGVLDDDRPRRRGSAGARCCRRP